MHPIAKPGTFACGQRMPKQRYRRKAACAVFNSHDDVFGHIDSRYVGFHKDRSLSVMCQFPQSLPHAPPPHVCPCARLVAHSGLLACSATFPHVSQHRSPPALSDVTLLESSPLPPHSLELVTVSALRGAFSRLCCFVGACAMASWGDVLGQSDGEDDGAQAGCWDEVLEESEAGEWGEVLEDSPSEAAGHEAGWGDVLAGSPSQGDGSDEPPQELVRQQDIVAVEPGAIGAAAASGEPVVADVVNGVRQRLHGQADDPFGIGRSSMALGALPADAENNGRALFSQIDFAVAQEFVRTERVQTNEAIAEAAGCHAHSEVTDLKSMMGAAVVHIEKAALAKVLDSLTNKVMAAGGRCISLTIRHRYDETPLKARARAALAEREAPQPSDGEAPHATMSLWDTACAKIVQHELCGSALFVLHGKHELLTFELPVGLHSVERTTAEVYLHMAEQVSPALDKLSARFERVQRLAATDGDNAIGKAERALSVALQPRVACLHTTCDAHRTSAIARKIADMTPSETSGMIQLALTLSAAGAMRSFRKILRKVVVDRLLIRQSEPGLLAQERRQSLLDLFCPVQPENGSTLIRRRVVEALANGDWDQAGCVEHVCKGCCRSREDTAGKMASMLCNILARQACPVFPRSRWTRADRTLRWLGMLWSLHRLLPTVYMEWASRLGTRMSAPAGPDQSAEGGLLAIENMQGSAANLSDLGEGAVPNAALADPTALMRRSGGRAGWSSRWAAQRGKLGVERRLFPTIGPASAYPSAIERVLCGGLGSAELLY